MAVQFEGYTLDRAGAPSFQHHIIGEGGTAKLSISETATPVAVTVAYGLTRRFIADVPAQKTAWLLAGVATKSPRVIGDKGESPETWG